MQGWVECEGEVVKRDGRLQRGLWHCGSCRRRRRMFVFLRESVTVLVRRRLGRAMTHRACRPLFPDGVGWGVRRLRRSRECPARPGAGPAVIGLCRCGIVGSGRPNTAKHGHVCLRWPEKMPIYCFRPNVVGPCPLHPPITSMSALSDASTPAQDAAPPSIDPQQQPNDGHNGSATPASESLRKRTSTHIIRLTCRRSRRAHCSPLSS